MELFTERLKLKDILPDRAKDIAKKYKLKEEDIEFIRKKNPLNAEDLQIEDGERAAIRYINTADVDRDNEIVLPSGGQVNDFKKSPTVLYAHNYQGLPVGKDIWIKHVQGKGWLAKTVYAKHQLADDVYNLVKEKFLNTSSIGFIPLESVKPGDKNWGRIGGLVKSEYGINENIFDKAKRIYTKWILLEHSDVPIPSNINALNIAVGKGLEIKSQELIDDLEIEIIDEAENSIDLSSRPNLMSMKWVPDDNKKDEVKDEIEDEIAVKEAEESDELVDLEEEEKIQIEKEEMFSDDFVTKPEETPDYIRLPAKGEEGKHDGHKIRTIDIDAKQGIKALYCLDCKKMITFLFDKAKDWDMAKAKKWMADHGKDYDDFIPKEESDDTHQPDVPQAKEEPSKGFSLHEIYEVVKENIELIKKLEDLTVELKAGAVLNRKNKQNLKNAQGLIQEVLDSAEPNEPVEESKGEEIEIEDDDLEIEEKEVKEEPEKENKGIDIDEKELVELIHSALKENVDKSVENVSKEIKQNLDDNFKRLTGKVM